MRTICCYEGCIPAYRMNNLHTRLIRELISGMKSQNTDRRIRHTRMALQESLIKLLNGRPISKITVTDICRLADINRSTFYLHYTDPEHLLDSISNELFEDIHALLNRTDDICSITDVLTQILELLAENAPVTRILAGPSNGSSFSQKVSALIFSHLASISSMEQDENPSLQLNYSYSFFEGGFLSVVRKWSESDFQEDSEEISGIIENIVNFSCLHG